MANLLVFFFRWYLKREAKEEFESSGGSERSERNRSQETIPARGDTEEPVQQQPETNSLKA